MLCRKFQRTIPLICRPTLAYLNNKWDRGYKKPMIFRVVTPWDVASWCVLVSGLYPRIPKDYTSYNSAQDGSVMRMVEEVQIVASAGSLL